MNIMRILLSLATHFGWELLQFGVKYVFLHGNLEEEVFIEIPHGYDSTRGRNKVKRLYMGWSNFPMHGLEYSRRSWCLWDTNKGSAITLLFKTFTRRKTQYPICESWWYHYWDDLIEKQLLKERLAIEFEMKDFRRLKYFLRIEGYWCAIEQNHKNRKMMKREGHKDDIAHYQGVVCFNVSYYIFMGWGLHTTY